MADSAAAPAEDDGGYDLEIILERQGRAGIGECSAEIVASDANCKRAADGVFDASAEGVGKAGNGSTQVIGSLDRHRAVYQTDAGQSLDEDSSIPVLQRIKHWAGKTAQDICTVRRGEYVACAGVAYIYDHSKAGVEVRKTVGIHSAEADALAGRCIHVDVGITDTRLKHRTSHGSCRHLTYQMILREKWRNQKEEARADFFGEFHSQCELHSSGQALRS